jgi:VWFA-related protein
MQMAGTRRLHSFIACLSLLLPIQTVPPQQADSPSPGRGAVPQAPQLIPRSHEERESRYQSLHRVVLNISVTNGSGTPVTGLQSQDFTLMKDETSERITSFREVRGGANNHTDHVVLVLDAVNNSAKDIATDKKEIENYLKRGRENLPYQTSIAVVAESGITVSDPSQDRAVVLRDLDTFGSGLHIMGCADDVNPNESFVAVWMPGAVSKIDSSRQLSCLNQRFVRSVSALRKLAVREENNPGRVILIWIGPGWPLLNNPQYRPDDEAVKQNLFDNLVDVLQALNEAQVTLDVLAPTGILRKTELDSGHGFVAGKGVEKEEDARAEDFSPQALARQSGGRVMIYGKNIREGISECITDLDSYYTLTFNSAPAAKPGEYHSLAVKVDKSGLSVRTNSTYYAEQ